MSAVTSASDRITAEVTAWPGVRAQTGRRGEWSFRLDRRELAHLHGDHAAHFYVAEARLARAGGPRGDHRAPGVPRSGRPGGPAD